MKRRPFIIRQDLAAAAGGVAEAAVGVGATVVDGAAAGVLAGGALGVARRVTAGLMGGAGA